MTHLVLNLVQWAGSHPLVAGLAIALVACLESLAFVGLVVPGAMLMLGAGALVGVGALQFWSTFFWAVTGAVVGDGVSYWLGHRYRDSLKTMKWVHAHPELLGRGEDFLRRHGGKSILLARFVGPVRPIVPVVAGTLGMSPKRFYLSNLLSALIWAPAHLLPGMAFGASLAIAGQVAGRLALGLALVVAFFWFVAWAFYSGYRWLAPRAQVWTARALLVGKRHPTLAWLIADIVDPDRPVNRPLALWLAILTTSAWLFFGVVEDVVSNDPLVYAGQAVYHFMQQLRTPFGDRFMIAVTELGDAAVVFPVVVAVLAWLFRRRAWRDAQYWLAATLFGMLAVEAMKYGFHLSRPIEIYSGNAANSFPSGHATMSTVVYGFLAVLSATSFRPAWRWLPFSAAALLVSGIGFSRLYLGAHWLADVAAGLSLGVAWITLLAVARARHNSHSRRIAGLPLVGLLALAVAGTWHVRTKSDADYARYAVRYPIRELSQTAWRDGAWQTLPASRIDLRGDTEQPLNVQWLGDPVQLAVALAGAGWHVPQALTLNSALNMLLPQPQLSELPTFPQLNDGRFESLVMVREAGTAGNAGQRYILRLWPTAVRLDGRLLWVGSAATQTVEKLPLVSYPTTSGGYDAAMQNLESALSAMAPAVVRRPRLVDDDGYRWSGQTLLLGFSAVP